jgi:hypothetical protein
MVSPELKASLPGNTCIEGLSFKTLMDIVMLPSETDLCQCAVELVTWVVAVSGGSPERSQAPPFVAQGICLIRRQLPRRSTTCLKAQWYYLTRMI